MSQKLSPEEFKKILDEQHQWPSIYVFKFIAHSSKQQELEDLFPKTEEVSLRPSSNGKYVSITARIRIESSEEVIRIYEKAWEIEGVISL